MVCVLRGQRIILHTRLIGMVEHYGALPDLSSRLREVLCGDVTQMIKRAGWSS